jgi:hypothetical protein
MSAERKIEDVDLRVKIRDDYPVKDLRGLRGRAVKRLSNGSYLIKFPDRRLMLRPEFVDVEEEDASI